MEQMDICQLLKTKLNLETDVSSFGFCTVIINKEKLLGLIDQLRNDQELQFTKLMCITAVDYPEYFNLVYHLRSDVLKNDIVVKVQLTDKTNAEVDTLSALWAGAEWFEREVFDLFGIRFTNHPNMKRLFMPEDWEGYPLRKDYDPEKVKLYEN